MLVPQDRNVLAALPKSQHPGAKKALAEIWGAEDKDHARRAAKAFTELYGVKWPKAAAKITDDLEELLAFYDFPPALDPPAHHEPDRVHVRDRPAPHQGHQGAGIQGRRHRDGVQADRGRPGRWRAVNAPHLVALVRAGACFERGILVERDDRAGTDKAAAEAA